MSAAKMAGVLGLVFGLMLAIVIMFVSTAITGYMGRFYTAFETMVPVIGLYSLITLPLGYGISGFILAYVSALVYNFVSDKVGGVKIDLK